MVIEAEQKRLRLKYRSHIMNMRMKTLSTINVFLAMYVPIKILDEYWEDFKYFTNGNTIFLYKDIFERDDRYFIFAHELMHIILEHHARVQGRHHRIWNYATDHVINSMLTNELGYASSNVYMDHDAPNNISSEGMYRRIMQNISYQPQQNQCNCSSNNSNDSNRQSGNGSGNESGNESSDSQSSNGNNSGNDPSDTSGDGDICPKCGKPKNSKYDIDDSNDGQYRNDSDYKNDLVPCGNDYDGKGDPRKHKGPGSPQNGDSEYADYLSGTKEAQEQLKKSRGIGTMDISREFELLKMRHINLEKYLISASKEVIQGTDSATWLYQNHIGRILRRKKVGSRIRIPKRMSRKCEIGIMIDVSGSIYGEELNHFMTFVRKLLAINNELYVIVIDDEIKFADKITEIHQIKLKGGGGTDLRVGYDKFLEEKIDFDVIFTLTDGYTPWPDSFKFRHYTVLIDSGNPAPPFGKTIII